MTPLLTALKDVVAAEMAAGGRLSECLKLCSIDTTDPDFPLIWLYPDVRQMYAAAGDGYQVWNARVAVTVATNINNDTTQEEAAAVVDALIDKLFTVLGDNCTLTGVTYASGLVPRDRPILIGDVEYGTFYVGSAQCWAAQFMVTAQIIMRSGTVALN